MFNEVSGSSILQVYMDFRGGTFTIIEASNPQTSLCQPAERADKIVPMKPLIEFHMVPCNPFPLILTPPMM